MLVLGETICLYKTLPLSSSIFSIKYVGAKTPFVANEEYAEAISIGVAAPAPKVNEITGSNDELIPILFAVVANFSPPSSDASLSSSHDELTILVNLIYEDTEELLEGLTAPDTGERRSAALESFNSNLDLFIERIEQIVASATSS